MNSDPTDKASGWKLNKNSNLNILFIFIISIEPGLKIYVKNEDSVLNSIRGEIIKPNKNIFELFSLFKDPEKRMLWDKNMKIFEIIKQLDENSDILYMKMQPPVALVSARDYVLYRYYINNKKHPEVFEKIGRKKTDKN